MSERTGLSSTTRAVRAAIATDREHGAVAPPIHLSATFAFAGFGKPRRFDYTRSGNPTRAHLADALADLEGGANAVVTSTGMSAVSLVTQLANPGDTIIAAHDCYGGTQRLFRALAQRNRCNVRFVDLTSPQALGIIAETRPRIVWIETPSNPLLRITDIRRVADCAHAAGALAVVDNTFLSPVLQQPISLGADIVVHSTTKYLNGHSDVVGGAVVAVDKTLGEELAWWANCLGITGAPFDSYLTLRGVRTLHSRMRDHLANADAVVDALCRHAAVRRVYYPGLDDHEGHDIARRQQTGFGAMVSFEIDGGVSSVELFASQLKCFTLAESLGGVESLVAHPATMTHASMDAAARANAGISDSLVRLSVGIESGEDLVNDLTAALDRVADACKTARRPSRASVASSKALSTEPSTNRAPVDVVLLGAGAIARELIEQVSAQRDGGPIRIVAVIDRSGFVFEEHGISHDSLRELCTHKRAGGALRDAYKGRCATTDVALREIASNELSRPILVDATAADTTDVLRAAIARGFDIVLANKIPIAGAQSAVDGLRDAARKAGRTILHEATVGAGLPVIDTLRKLIDSGDDVQSIEGCPSGTLGFLFAEIGKGERFSVALATAVERGYTEPDPRVDLSGIDVARKALILARDIGFRGELSDVAVESLVPASLRDVSREEFLARCTELDAEWIARATHARETGNVLRYRARVTPESIVVGLVEVPVGGSLGALCGTDNQFTFTTRRYDAQPLVITGPGAGPAVTAAGVLNDLLWVERAGEGIRRPPRNSENVRAKTTLNASRRTVGSLA